MPVKIRLTRQGRKRKPYYHIVIADSRAPRDGRYIERIGMYNPNTNPATIELDFDRALEWLQKGAQPTETCRAILSYKGVLMKKHLLEGVKKNAFSEEEAEKRFDNWLNEKEAKIQDKRDKIKKSDEADIKQKIEIESQIREAKAQEIAKKNAALAEEAEKATAESTEQDETSPPETDEAAVVEEAEKATETVEEKEAEVKEEASTEEKAADDSVESEGKEEVVDQKEEEKKEEEKETGKKVEEEKEKEEEKKEEEEKEEKEEKVEKLEEVEKEEEKDDKENPEKGKSAEKD